MTLPQLPRQPLRPEMEDAARERELWQPRWKCFCCRDSGLVQLQLVRLVVFGYDHRADKPVVCRNSRCEAGEIYRSDPNYDQRFSALICAELDRISREDWQRTVLTKLEQIQQRVKDTAKQKSFRRRDRSGLEELEAQRRHEEILNADPEALRAMVRAYLGDDWMEEGSP